MHNNINQSRGNLWKFKIVVLPEIPPKNTHVNVRKGGIIGVINYEFNRLGNYKNTEKIKPSFDWARYVEARGHKNK